MTTPGDYRSDHHLANYSPNYPPPHDPTVGQTNADMAAQHYYHQKQQQQQQLHQHQAWQQQQQQHQLQQHQLQLQPRGQGREMFSNQSAHPAGDPYGGTTKYPNKHLPLLHSNLGSQPMSFGGMNAPQRDYDVGTNATSQQNRQHRDNTPHDHFNNPPRSLDSFHSKNAPPVSEGINEKIRVQADLQRRQQQEEFESGLALDPFLVCHKCNRQFREGQLPEYRHHIDNCPL